MKEKKKCALVLKNNSLKAKLIGTKKRLVAGGGEGDSERNE